MGMIVKILIGAIIALTAALFLGTLFTRGQRRKYDNVN
jgi:hypothetical protein